MKILLVVYDNGSLHHFFPLGLAYIATYLKRKGHQIEVYNQDQHHWPDHHLTRHLDANDFDAVCLSFIAGYYQYKKILSISSAIRSSKSDLFFVLGGHGPSPEPEFFLRKTKADVIVRGEGEVTVVELFEHINDKEKWKDIPGIAYLDYDKHGGVERCVTTGERPLIDDVNSIQYPAWDLFPVDYYAMLRVPNISDHERSFPVLSGRGCPFQCNFCYRMDKGCRIRTPESILDEIQYLRESYNISYIIFADDLLMVSKKRTFELCQAIIDSDLSIKWWCNGRLNFASRDVLEIMKRAGCVFVNYGIESLDQKTLNVMKKGITIEMIYKGVEETLSCGLSPGLNIIYGNIKEPKEALDKAVNFLLKYDDHSQLRTIRPVTPYPGSPLYYYAMANGLLEGPEDFYENKHVNSDLLAVNFTELTDDEFHAALYHANAVLINKHFDFRKESVLEISRKLYFEKQTAFRGFKEMA